MKTCEFLCCWEFPPDEFEIWLEPGGCVGGVEGLLCSLGGGGSGLDGGIGSGTTDLIIKTINISSLRKEGKRIY